MGKIRWTEKASANLQAIHEYIARDSKTYAARFIKSLIKATAILQDMPRSGRIVPEFENPELREVIYQNYRVVYRNKEGSDDIGILAVVHSARDVTQALRQEWEL